jgi:hypothetical protein
MRTTSASSDEDRANDRDRQLEQAIRHALILAAGRRVANRTLRRARIRAHRNPERRFGRAASHLVGYAALLGYIWYRERAHKAA